MTQQKINKIKDAYYNRYSPSQIAVMFALHVSTVSKIIKSNFDLKAYKEINKRRNKVSRWRDVSSCNIVKSIRLVQELGYKNVTEYIAKNGYFHFINNITVKL